jgi:hypothetical protein
MERTSTKIPSSIAEVGLCMCPKCPVEVASSCGKGRISGIQGTLNKRPLQGEDMPGLYCSTGTATWSVAQLISPSRCDSHLA